MELNLCTRCRLRVTAVAQQKNKEGRYYRVLLGARTLLEAPGLTTRSKDATIGAPGLTTRSKDATIGAPGLTTLL